MDGPDGLHSCWHDLRKGPDNLARRHNGGGGDMFWGAFSAFGKTPLVEIRGGQTLQSYTGLMEDYLLPFSNERIPVSCLSARQRTGSCQQTIQGMAF